MSDGNWCFAIKPESMVSRSELSKVAAVSSIGSLIEWYDFFIAGAAAGLVWPAIFYPKESTVAGIIFSISTFGLTYFSRPVGNLIFGHLGDRIGRKTTLIWTLITMAIAMFGIALTPGYASIGIAAPVLIALFRLIQGIGIGGEWQGGVVWVVEHAAGRRSQGFWASVVQSALAIGLSTGTLAFFIARTLFPGAAFLNYGWRLPFVVGGFVVIIGIVIRYLTSESPLFKQIRQTDQIERAPSLAVWKTEWKKILLFATICTYTIVVENFSLNPFGISYMTAKGIPINFVTLAIATGAAFGIIAVLLAGALSDRIGRRKVFLLGAGLNALVIYPFWLMVNTKDQATVLAAIIMLFFVNFIGTGVEAITFSEQFPTKFRYSGVGWSFQIAALVAGVLLVGVLPIILGYSHGPANAWPYIAALTIIDTVIAFFGILVMKERRAPEMETAVAQKSP